MPLSLMTSWVRLVSCHVLSVVMHACADMFTNACHAYLVWVAKGGLLRGVAVGTRLPGPCGTRLSVLGHTSPWIFMEKPNECFGDWSAVCGGWQPNGRTDTWLIIYLSCMQLVFHVSLMPICDQHVPEGGFDLPPGCQRTCLLHSRAASAKLAIFASSMAMASTACLLRAFAQVYIYISHLCRLLVHTC